jgi:ATP phosphoribosyltransferase regulatory subunit
VDYFDIIRGGAGEGFADSIFKVQDGDGRLLSMRGEVTTQIARMLVSKARNEGRLFYITNCIRFLGTKSMSQREFWQAGAELVGGREAEADAEVIALSLSALESVGIREASIDVGNVELFKTVAERFGISEFEDLKRAVASKSLGDLKKVTPDKRAQETFSHIMTRRGGPEVVRELSRMVGEGFDGYVNYFDELFGLLKTYGCADRVRVDLSTLREMKYYNGTVFEIFLGGLGVPIGGGGRYDTMMKEFGLEDTRATGFAMSVDLCVKALEASGFNFEGSRASTMILYYDGFRDKAIRLAREMRRKGIICTVEGYNGQGEGIAVGREIIDLKTGKRYAP